MSTTLKNSKTLSAAKKNAKKKAAKARKNAEAKKAENEVVEDIAGLIQEMSHTDSYLRAPSL